MKYKAEVQVYGETSYHSNALRFDTVNEAETYAKDLMSRWILVETWRVVEDKDEKQTNC